MHLTTDDLYQCLNSVRRKFLLTFKQFVPQSTTIRKPYCVIRILHFIMEFGPFKYVVLMCATFEYIYSFVNNISVIV